MSRQAYLEIYGQEPPSDGRFGADIAWFQASSDGESLDSGKLNDTWSGLVQWAEYVCIRTSYGSTGNDGAQQAHIQYADIHSYSGTLGCYHYYIPGAGPAANANNYLNRVNPLGDRIVFDMLDVEEGTSAQAIEECLDRIAQARGRDCLLYSGKSIMDNAGFLSRKRPLWVAHYATRQYEAWAPTSNWAEWKAPYMPNQYGSDYPTCWQFTSFTANHGHLDLNITTTPAAFGLDGLTLTPSRPVINLESEEDDMRLKQIVQTDNPPKPGNGTVFILDGVHAYPTSSGYPLEVMVANGVLAPAGNDQAGNVYHVDKDSIYATYIIMPELVSTKDQDLG